MSNFVGIVNLNQDLTNEKNIIIDMNDSLSKKDCYTAEYHIDNHVLLGHNILAASEASSQSMSFSYHENIYTIIYNGQIYNSNELRDELKEKGFSFETLSDTELLLKAYAFWKEDIVHKLNGMFAFAIWDSMEKRVFIVRDHFGIKPLYYTVKNNYLIFASEIKAILKFPGISSKLDVQGINELFGIGPAHTSGITAFKDIYELKPAHYMIYNKYGIHINQYWKLESKPHTDSLGKTCETVRYLLEKSIKNQLTSDVPMCTFLSGGLDSSIITLYTANYFKEKRTPSS